MHQALPQERAQMWPQRDQQLRSVEAELENARGEIQKPSLALPLLFTIEYSLAKLWTSWGVAPKAMIGHSMG